MTIRNCFTERRGRTALIALLAVLSLTSAGCWGRRFGRGGATPPPPPVLGHSVDPHFQKQEEAGESQDFVIYDHEFYEDTPRLTPDGEDHLRQIAARAGETPFPIIVEMSKSTPNEATQHEYPISANPELDMRRVQVVVRSLSLMGVSNAQTRVVVAPALSPGYTSFEGERAYNTGIGGWGGGFGGGFGGGGFGGGGFGGGGFF